MTNQIPIETPTGAQNKVDDHDVDGAAHADIRALIAGGSTPDATGSVKGKVQLAGDLGGTAASPTVPGLVAKADASALTAHTGNTSNPHSVTKAQVGLGNVDNTSNATERAATATLTNKTLTAPVINSPTGIVEGDIANLTSDLAGKAASVHTHAESDVTSLVSDLAAKQPLDSDLTTIAGLTATTDNIIQSVGSAWASRTPTQVKAALAIAESDVTNLVTDLAAKAASVHTHAESDVTSLVSDLAGKQPLDSDLTTIAGLTATTDSFLQSKSSAWTTRTIAQVKTDLAVPSLPILESDVTGLVSDLAAKQPLDSDLTTIAGLTATTDNMIQSVGSAWASRTPAQVKAALAIAESDVTNLVTDLSGKAATVHTHAASDVTSGTVATARLGSGSASSTTFLRGDQTWATPAGGGGPTLTPTAVKTTTYTAAAGDFVPCDSTSGGFTVTLPAAPADGTQVGIKHVIQGSTNIITYACGGSDVFNKTGGGTSGTLPYLAQAVWLQYKASGGIWYILADDLPLSQSDLRYQPLDSDLTTIAGLTATSDNFMVGASSAWASRTPAQAKTSLAITEADVSGLTADLAAAKYFNGDILASGETTISRAEALNNAGTSTSQVMRLTYFTALKTETTTQVRTICGSTAAGATPTLCQIGLYTIDASDNGTLVASTANDTALWATTITAYTKSWASSYAKVAGQRYALAMLCVTAAAAPTWLASTALSTGASLEAGVLPRICGSITGQTSLPSTFTAASVTGNATIRVYAAILP